MLTFLRRIRKSLIDSLPSRQADGSAKTYLFYAVGEIALVVIGILIAVQINNWNTKNVERKLETQHLRTIVGQLQLDKNTLANEKSYNLELKHMFEKAKEIIASRDFTKQDTLGKIAILMMEYPDFRRQSNVYQTLVNSGEIGLIKSSIIKESLPALEQTYNYINRLEGSHERAIIELILLEIRNPIRLDPFEVVVPEMLYNFRFENNFSMLLNLMEEEYSLYEKAQNEIDLINDQIKNYLDKGN